MELSVSNKGIDMTEINTQEKKKHYTPKKTQTDADKSESTTKIYIKEAEGFLVRECDNKGIARTAGNICKALKDWSSTVQANTYIKRQCALEYHQYKNKFYKSAEQIRNTQRINYGGSGNGQKKPHCRTVKEEQHRQLLFEANKNNNKEVASSLSIAYFLGLRPKEMNRIEYSKEENQLFLFISSAKQNKEGTRSIDRVIKVELNDVDTQSLITDINCLRGLTDKQIVNMRVRACRLSEKVFKGKKRRPTLYSYRHQLGADLKGLKTEDGSSIVDRKEAAAIFSHRSQNSLNSYGHANASGGLNRSLPRATESTIRQVNDDLNDSGFMATFNTEPEPTSDSTMPVNTSPPTTGMAEFILQRIEAEKQTVSISEITKSDKPTKISRHRLDDDTDFIS